MEDDEYIVQDDSQVSNNRPFFTAVGVLLVVFILAAGCAAFSLLSRGSTDEVAMATVSAIETQNAVVAVTNEAVTATIAAMQTEAARPTETPSPPPTFTPTPQPTATPQPTNTPVIAEETVESGDLATPNLSGTSVFENATGDNTPTPIPVTGGSGDNGSLPNTGLDTWGIMLIGLVLVAVLFMARRLRRV